MSFSMVHWNGSLFWREMHAWMCEGGYFFPGTKYPEIRAVSLSYAQIFCHIFLPVPAFGYLLLGESAVCMVFAFGILRVLRGRGKRRRRRRRRRKYVIALPWVVLE